MGHTGFVGGHLYRAFREGWPHLEIIGRSTPTMDLRKAEEAEKLSDCLNLQTALIMCSAIKRQFGDTLETFSQNVSMCLNLCRVLEKRPVKRLIYFSSTAVYGEDIHNTHISEETENHPTSYYGLAKYVGENLFLKTIQRRDQSSLVILRPPVIYGAGDRSRTYGPAGFIKDALGNRKIVLWGDGTEYREFIYIADIVRIVSSLIFSHGEGVVNIASGTSHTFKEILNILSHLISDHLEITSRPRTKDKVDNQFDNRKFVSLINGFDFTALDKGIKETFDLENENHKKAEPTVSGGYR